MIEGNFYKLLVLTPADKKTGAEMIKSLQDKYSGFHRNYAAIVLQDGLTLEKFLGNQYKELRETAYSVCKSKTILMPGINKLD